MATWVTIVSAVTGGAFALYSYWGNSQGARAKEALVYIDRFTQPPVSTSFDSFTQFWISRGIQASDTDASMKKAIYSNPIVQADTDVVIRFFDSAAACTCKHLCDEDLVRHFLGTEAGDVFAPAGPYIYDRRTSAGDLAFGVGLETMAKGSKLDCSFLRMKPKPAR